MTRLIIGLGNPGREYEGTRHNIGFRVAEALAEKLGVGYKTKRRFSAEIAEASRGGDAWILAKPRTYMNLSGESVAALRDWYKIEPPAMIVAFDDADLELGRLRIRGMGGSGGHRGMQSILEALGTNEIARVRLGIGRGEGQREELRNHVLTRFQRNEEKQVEEMVARAVQAIESWSDRGMAATMNDFNKK